MSRMSRCILAGVCFVLLVLAASAQQYDESALKGLRWRQIGPFRGGRAIAVAGVPGDPYTFYFGAVAGGVWKTTDGGLNWTPIFDKQPVASIGAIAVAPSDPNVIYGAYGAIQVSRDGGNSWTVTGPAPEGLIQLAASPTTADRLYAATRVGLQVSDDVGATWSTADFDTEVVSMVRGGSGGRLFAFVVGRGLLTAAESDPKAWTPLAGNLGNRILLHLAIDRADASRLYAITYEGDVIASADGGRDWQSFGAP